MKKENNHNDSHIVITSKSILTFFVIIGSLYLTYLIRNVLVLIFLGLILALALEPMVHWFYKRRVPYGLSVFLVVMISIASLALVGSLALVPLLHQISLLSSNFPYYVQSVLSLPGYEQFSSAIVSQLSAGSQQIFSITLGAFSSLLSAIIVTVFAIYILLDFDNLRSYMIGFFHPEMRKSAQKTLTNIEVKLKDWLRGQIALMIIIGLMSYIGLMLFGLRDYALALAVIAGFLEVIPVIGPTLSVVPAAIIGFTFSTATGIGIIGLYIIIQQLENSIIVPKIMQKAVGFNPIITIVAFMVGAELFGILGAILSLPVVIIISEIFKSWHGYNFLLKPKDQVSDSSKKDSHHKHSS